MIASKGNIRHADFRAKSNKKKNAKQTRVWSAKESNGNQTQQLRSFLGRSAHTSRSRQNLVTGTSAPSLLVLGRPSEVKPLLPLTQEDESADHTEEPEDGDEDDDDEGDFCVSDESGIRTPGRRVLSEKELRKEWLSKGAYSTVPTNRRQREGSSPVVEIVSRERNVEVGKPNFRGREQAGSGRTLPTPGRRRTKSTDCAVVTPPRSTSESARTRNCPNSSVGNRTEANRKDENHNVKLMGNKSVDHSAPTTVKRSLSLGNKSPSRRGASRYVSLRHRSERLEARDDPSVGEESLCSGATMTTAETGASSLQYSPMAQYSLKKGASPSHTPTDYRLIATYAPDSSASSTASSDDVLSSDREGVLTKTVSEKGLRRQVSTSVTSSHRGQSSTNATQKRKKSADCQRQGWRLLRNNKKSQKDAPERTSRSKLHSEPRSPVSSPPRVDKRSVEKSGTVSPKSPESAKSFSTGATPASFSRIARADGVAAQELKTGGQYTRKRLASTCRRDYLSGHVALRRGRHNEALIKLNRSLRAYLPIRGADDLEVAAVHELLGATHVRMIERVPQEGSEALQAQSSNQPAAEGSDAFHMEKALLHYRAVLRILDALERNEQERRESYTRRRREYLERKRRKAANDATEEIPRMEVGDDATEEIPRMEVGDSLHDDNDIEDVVQMMTQARRGGFSDCLDKEPLDSVNEGSDDNENDEQVFEETVGRNGAASKEDLSRPPAPGLPRVVPRHLNLVHRHELTMPPAPPAVTPPSSFRGMTEGYNGEKRMERPADDFCNEKSPSRAAVSDDTRRRQFRRHQLRYRRYFETITNTTEMRRRASWSLDALEGKSSSLIEF